MSIDELRDCPLCNEIHNSPNSFSKILRTRFESLLETSNFILISDIAPIINGHSLLVSKDCYPSFAATPSHMLSELAEIKKLSEGLFSKRHRYSFWFEHGCKSDTSTGCSCVNHAHMHFFPTDISIDGYLMQHVFPGDNKVTEHRSFPKLLESITYDYLYYEKIGRKPVVIDIENNPVESQLIRRAVAQTNDIKEWNWLSILKSKLAINV